MLLAANWNVFKFQKHADDLRIFKSHKAVEVRNFIARTGKMLDFLVNVGLCDASVLYERLPEVGFTQFLWNKSNMNPVLCHPLIPLVQAFSLQVEIDLKAFLSLD